MKSNSDFVLNIRRRLTTTLTFETKTLLTKKTVFFVFLSFANEWSIFTIKNCVFAWLPKMKKLKLKLLFSSFLSFPTHNYLPTVIGPLSNPLDCKTERRYSYQLSIELLATIFCNFQQQKEKRNRWQLRCNYPQNNISMTYFKNEYFPFV